MKGLRVARKAARDLDDIFAIAEEKFGAVVAGRYRQLVRAALLDLRRNAERPGVVQLPETPPGLRFYHLRYSRDRVTRGHRIAKPRHFLALRLDGEKIVIVRVLHESMDIPRHVRIEELEE